MKQKHVAGPHKVLPKHGGRECQHWELLHRLHTAFQHFPLDNLKHHLQNTYCKQYKVLLVILSYTVIDPRAVMIHFPNAPLANTERTQVCINRSFPSRNIRFHRGLGNKEIQEKNQRWNLNLKEFTCHHIYICGLLTWLSLFKMNHTKPNHHYKN